MFDKIKEAIRILKGKHSGFATKYCDCAEISESEYKAMFAGDCYEGLPEAYRCIEIFGGLENRIREGWKNYAYTCPPRNVLVEFLVPDLFYRKVVANYTYELLSEYKPEAVYWRLTGIGKEQLEATNLQKRAISEANAASTAPLANWGCLSGSQANYLGGQQHQNSFDWANLLCRI